MILIIKLIKSGTFDDAIKLKHRSTSKSSEAEKVVRRLPNTAGPAKTVQWYYIFQFNF